MLKATSNPSPPLLPPRNILMIKATSPNLPPPPYIPLSKNTLPIPSVAICTYTSIHVHTNVHIYTSPPPLDMLKSLHLTVIKDASINLPCYSLDIQPFNFMNNYQQYNSINTGWFCVCVCVLCFIFGIFVSFVII